MFRSSFLHETRREKYEWRDELVEPEPPDLESGLHDYESLRELNERFARYIARARVLEQANAVFRKQLETLCRMEEETSGLEEMVSQQMGLNRQRIRELTFDRARLERERKDSQRVLDEFNNRYRSECEYQQQLRGTLDMLNKDADAALLANLEMNVQLQFLQDEMNATKERYKKDLAEIQAFVSILQQIDHTALSLQDVSMGDTQAEERLVAQRRIPALRAHLDEMKSALSVLQEERQWLQSQTSTLEHTIRTLQESYSQQMLVCNEKIDALRGDIEEAERTLESLGDKCHQHVVHQNSLENELERYKRIIESEDSRLNLAITGTPSTLYTSSYRYTHTQPTSRQEKDLGQVMKDVTSVKPRQKNLGKQKKEKRTKAVLVRSPGEEEQVAGQPKGPSPKDVPDGSQISKALDALRGLWKDKDKKVTEPEPQVQTEVQVHSSGRYVTVSGEGSYTDPCFCSTCSSGHVYVNIQPSEEGEGEGEEDRGGSGDEDGDTESTSIPTQPPQTDPETHTTSIMSPTTLSYEKVEMVESIQKISDDKKVRGYEETSVIVETMIEKSSKKKAGDGL